MESKNHFPVNPNIFDELKKIMTKSESFTVYFVDHTKNEKYVSVYGKTWKPCNQLQIIDLPQKAREKRPCSEFNTGQIKTNDTQLDGENENDRQGSKRAKYCNSIPELPTREEMKALPQEKASHSSFAANPA